MQLEYIDYAKLFGDCIFRCSAHLGSAQTLPCGKAVSPPSSTSDKYIRNVA
jgi:hypothetical protein